MDSKKDHVKKVPMRQCIGCGERKEKKELIRVIRTPEGQIELDTSGRKNGRGAYLCRSVECLKKSQKKKTLSRSLQVEIPEAVYEQLEKEMMSHGQ